jgi:hypothetical protein
MITVRVTHKKNNGKKIPSATIQLTLPPGRKQTRNAPTVLSAPGDGNKTKQSQSEGKKKNRVGTLTKGLTEDLKTQLKHIIFTM